MTAGTSVYGIGMRIQNSVWLCSKPSVAIDTRHMNVSIYAIRLLRILQYVYLVMYIVWSQRTSPFRFRQQNL